MSLSADHPWSAHRVRSLRRWLHASQTELADRLGTRQQTVSEWETGVASPRRMSRRLLHLVAEESGYYAVESEQAGAPSTTQPPTDPS